MSKRRRGYRRIFLEASGVGPWLCYGCFMPVQPDELLVHHIDEDPSNNAIENLAAMHLPCHDRLHNTGHAVSDETREKIAATKRGKPRSEETKRKISETLRLKHAAKAGS